MRSKKAFTVVRAHAEGEVGNVVIGGLVDVPGETMFEKKLFLETERDDIRRLILLDPRGAVNYSVNFVLPPCDPAADMGYVIAESTEYPAMSGSNTMCTATVLLEMGILSMVEPVTNLVLESPAGLIRLECTCAEGKVTSVRLINQPAFVYHLDATIEVEGFGDAYRRRCMGWHVLRPRRRKVRRFRTNSRRRSRAVRRRPEVEGSCSRTVDCDSPTRVALRRHHPD